jgi:hypothetical protein
MTSAPKKNGSPLVDAVTRFDAELGRYEALVQETERIKLTSEKHVFRVHRALADCAEEEQRLVGLLTEFVDAMRAAQTRQEQAMAVRVQAVERLETKLRAREELVARLAKLGDHAREVSTAIASLFTGKGPELTQADVVASLGEVEARTGPIVDEAEALRCAAEAAEWLDIARDADSFKQQLGAARKKVNSLVTERARSVDVGVTDHTTSNGKAKAPNGGGSQERGS